MESPVAPVWAYVKNLPIPYKAAPFRPELYDFAAYDRRIFATCATADEIGYTGYDLAGKLLIFNRLYEEGP